MRITDFLKKECVKVYLQGTNKKEIINELLELILRDNPAINREEASRGVFKREKIESTAIGRGVAIPHARIESCNDICVAFGLLAADVDLNSLDSMPVKLVFLILFPKDKLNLQLRFLARAARLLQHGSLHDALMECKNSKAVLETFKNYEDKHFH